MVAIVSNSMPVMNPGIRNLWWSRPNIFILLPIPLASLAFIIMIWRDLHTSREIRLFLLSIGVFFTAYIGLGNSLRPFAVPFAITFRQAAAAPASQSLLLVGTVILLPLVLGYTAYCYYLFRGKASHEPAY